MGENQFQTEALLLTGTYTVFAWNAGSGRETGPYNISLNMKAGDPGSLVVAPEEGLHGAGLVGGAFFPASKTYVLENRGQVPIEWTLTKTQSWLMITPVSGTLSPGESQDVTVSIDQNLAKGLPVETYTDTLIFTNITEANRRFIRGASLRVDPIEGILEVTPVDDSSFSGPPGEAFDTVSTGHYTLKNNGQKEMNWRASNTAFWLSISPDHGSLEPGKTAEVSLILNEIVGALSNGVRTDTVIFTNQSNGYGNTSRNVTLSIGVSPSDITTELSQSQVVLGAPLSVSGKIAPAPCDAGAWVDVVLSHPGGMELHRSAIANTKGEFSYPVLCTDIQNGGSWTINTTWSGDRCLGAATSTAQPLEVIKADTRVTIDAGSQAVKLGDLVDISGKFTPDPDCGANLTDLPIRLLIIGPGGRSNLRTVTTSDPFGHFVLKGFDGFNALGQWSVKALFLGNEAYEESSSEVITVQVVETAGYAVIVQGKIQSEEGLASHNKTANFVYQQLRQRGLLDDDIYYLNYDGSQGGVDDIPSRANVEYGITTWARDRMNSRPANLYIVLVDHGLDESFFIYPDEISSSDVSLWLDTLQNDLFGQSAVQEIIVLLGFCRSGSFLDQLGGWNRVVIASAAAGESSYKGPLDPNDPLGVRDGEFFITEFFKAAAVGKDVLSCFRESVEKTEAFTSTGTGEANAPYRDDSRQHPLMDDNGDGAGENVPTGDPGYDGYLSRSLFIGVSSVTGNTPGDVQVIKVSGTQFLGAGESTAAFWARVDDNKRMRSLWLEVKPPGFQPGPGGTEQVEMDLPGHAYDTYNGGANRYEWSPIQGFSAPGTYQVFFFARDDMTGNESSLKEAFVYKAKEGNSPPSPFDLRSPLDGSEQRTVLLLDWGDSTDPDGDPITYTVEISTDPSFSTVVHRAERLGRSYYFISEGAGLNDLTTYYWRVKGIDVYGGSTTSSQVWSFGTNNTNPLVGFIRGKIMNSATQQPLQAVVVRVGTYECSVLPDGDYFGVLPPGTYEVKAMGEGYREASYVGVVIRDFGLEPEGTAVKGDINGDKKITLGDAILALKIACGVSTGGENIDLGGDVNGDVKIGMEEVTYALQKVANPTPL
ncbi:MAG: hypothetical protein JRJ31_02065 [Deltaproteobacteria bacterium]|nr:hypothetical protein [Deltaproteobacteria bacterium]